MLWSGRLSLLRKLILTSTGKWDGGYMIYVTGDTHGPVKLGHRSLDGIGQRLSKDNLRSKNIPEFASDDFVIICGDFGCI